MTMKNPRRLGLTTALTAFLLAACGGGDDPAQPAPPSAAAQPLASEAVIPTTPIVRAKPQKSVDPNSFTASKTEGRPGAAVQRTNRLYIVQLAEPPASANPNLRPPGGARLDRRSPNVAAYVNKLRATQDAVAARVGARKVYSYSYVFNGFAAELTEAQADKLRTTKGVLAVNKDTLRKVNMATTPSFLGLSGNGGFWNQTGVRGENVIIGIVDGGVWPEHPSFSDKADNNGDYQPGMPGSGYSAPPARWSGTCVTGEEFTPAMCNNKLIGARYYNAGWGGNDAIDADLPHEFNSPRDWGGHGTHTASTAGGNGNVTITGPAALFGKISGVAPRARIAVYKACFDPNDGTGGSCWSTDSMAAIEDAVADGVDVINFSVGGSTDTLLEAVELAFMNAAEMGVFVATSAGNDGPDPSTVGHPSPWLTTVASGTHPRATSGTVTLGNGASYTGASVNFAPLASTAVILAADAVADGQDADAARLCYAASDNGSVPVLDPAKVAGKVVVCDRGTTARVDKSKAVFEAGGAGMILVNTSLNSLNNDFHSVPTVHLAHTDRDAIRSYVMNTGSPMAAIPAATVVTNAPAPLQSEFSSRGPTFAARSELLKPDITAPGSDIVAAVSPPGNSGRSFDLYSGTSMASPHIAGIAALFKQARPTWSPMMIKSALMTTAAGLQGASQTDAEVLFGQGAGHVRPQNALNPGLVFDHGIFDWLGFLCGTELDPAFCAQNGIRVVQPRNLNLPSIAVANVAGTQTITRTVRNVTNTNATYKPTVTGVAGFTVSVTPASMKVRAGQTASFSVKFTRNGAALSQYQGGQLTWSDGVHTVRMPIVAQPVALSAPAEVGGTYQVSFGYTGPFSTQSTGMVPATKSPHTIQTGQTRVFTINVPAGTAYARFALFDSDVSLASDLDLYVYKGGVPVAYSAGVSAQEVVSLVNPAPGNYTVYVDGYDVPGGPASFNLYNWNLSATPGGEMIVSAPTTATSGGTGTVRVTPCQPARRTKVCTLPAGNKYMGMISYSGSPAMPSPTIVFIE